MATDRISSQALDAVIRTHIAWVRGCARRRVGDEHLAEDVTQAVFMLLAQKYRTMPEDVKMTGWLFRAVQYCAANALRARARRQRHEQQAGECRCMEGTNQEAGWKEIAPALEGAMDRLRQKDRTLLILRYYRDGSMEEIAQKLGITQATARKRLQRAVERLRATLATRGVVTTAGGLAAALPLTQTMGVASAATTATAATSAAGGAAAGGGTATGAAVIAKAAGVGMAGAALGKAAAAVAAALLAVATVTGTAVMLSQAPATPSSATSPGAATAMAPMEYTYLAYAEFMLSPAGAMRLEQSGVLQPVETASKGYRAAEASAADVRRVVGQSMRSREIHGWGACSTWWYFNEVQPRQNPSPCLQVNCWPSNRSNALQMVGSFESQLEHPFLLADKGTLKVRMKYEMVAAQLWLNGRNLEPGPAVLEYAGEVAPGRVVVFVKPIPAARGETLAHVVMLEAFRAPPVTTLDPNMFVKAQWWLEQGSEQMRQDLGRLYAWQALARSSPPADKAQWTRTLSDGKTIELLAVAEPLRWPGCFWTPQGQPAKTSNPHLYTEEDERYPLQLYFWISGPGEEYERSHPEQKNPHPARYQVGCFIPWHPARPEVEVGALTGEFREIGRWNPQDRRAIEEGGFVYEIHPQPQQDDVRVFKLKARGRAPWGGAGVRGVAILGDGTRQWEVFSGHFTELTYTSAEHPPTDTRFERDMIFHVPGQEITHIVLMRRTLEWAKFPPMAVRPMVLPVEEPDEAQLVQAHAIHQQRQTPAEAARIGKEKEFREKLLQQRMKIPADRASAIGALRLFLEKTAAGDEKGACALAMAKEPGREKDVEAIVHMLATQHALRTLAIDRFGPQPVADLSQRRQILRDMTQKLLCRDYQEQADGSLSDGLCTLQKSADGQFGLTLDTAKMVSSLPRMQQQVDQLREALAKDEKMTLEAFGALCEKK